jgi:hypothetical protein
LKLHLKESNTYILAIYKAPTGNVTNFLDSIEDNLNFLDNSRTECIICGDININYLIDTYMKNQLNSLLISYNLFDIVDFPTRIQNTLVSVTDNIL